LTKADQSNYNRPFANLKLENLAFKIGFVPDNADSRDLADWLWNLTMASKFQYPSTCTGGCNPFYLSPELSKDDIFVYFASQQAVDAYVGGDYYAQRSPTTGRYVIPLRAVVQLQNWPTVTPGVQVTNEKWDYTLRYNATQMCEGNGRDQVSCYRDVPSTSLPEVDTLNRDSSNSKYFSLYSNGFVGLQSMIDMYITTQKAGIQSKLVNGFPPFTVAGTAPFPTAAYISDPFVTFMGAVLGIWFMLVFLWPFSRLVRGIVEEKELKLKEGMKMMGLTDTVFWSSWLCTYAFMFAITAILITIFSSGSVYAKSDGSVVFVFFWLFMMSLFAFGCLVSTFFDRSKTASTFATLIFFAIFFPYFAVNTDETSHATKILACLSSPIGLGLGGVKIAEFEAAGFGSHWSNLDEVVANFSVGNAMRMFLLDIFIYFTLALYFDKVLPSRFGTRLPPWFFLSPAWWRECCPSRQGTNDVELKNLKDTAPSGPRIEPVALGGTVGISIRNLRKEFDGQSGKIIAVDNTSLDLYEGQILALLGHNGAGKTTTISMLTGLYPPSSGDAYVYGHSIRYEMNKVRQDLGICPQEDILFPTLTVKEHLQLFASLRGMSDKKKMAQIIEEILQSVALKEKEHSAASTLSGGQKRKLCTAMALIGDAKVVFLDEPTSGMDPLSRRSFWSFLKERTKGRIIILTTHMMDEADQLGDRIAIMAKGTIKCCGSPLFLKREYGVGYTMTVTQDETKKGTEEALTKMVMSHVPDVEPPKVFATEIAFRLPFMHTARFPALFTDMDSDIRTGSNVYGVKAYGISVTTLEEVFLRVDQEAHTHEKANAAASPKEHKAGYSAVDTNSPAEEREDRFRDGRSFFCDHFRALLMKRFHNFKRDKKALLYQVILPLFVLIIGLAVLKFGVPTLTYPSKALGVGSYALPLYVPYNLGVKATANITCPTTFPQCYNIQAQDKTQLKHRCQATAGCCWNMFYASCSNCQECNYGYVPNNATFSSTDLFNSATVPSSSGVIPVPVDYTNSSLSMAQYLLASVGRTPTQADLDLATKLNNNNNYQRSVAPEDFLLTTTSPYPNQRLHTTTQYGAFYSPVESNWRYSWNDQLNTMQGVIALANITGVHALPITVNLFSNVQLRKLTGSSDAGITVRSYPFAGTKKQQLLSQTPSTIMAVIIISIAFCFIPASFVMFVIRERETNAKHQQLISGVGFPAYWLSSYLWDVLMYIITAAISILVLVIFDISKLVGDNLGATSLAIFLFGFSVTGFGYAFSFLFKSPSSGQNAMIFFNFIFGVILVIVSFVLDLIPSTQSTNASLKYIYRIIPNYCLGDALMNLLFRDNVIFWGRLPGIWDMDIVGYDMLYMGIESIGFIIVTLIIERIGATPKCMALCERRPQRPNDADEPEEPDVAAERQRLIESHKACTGAEHEQEKSLSKQGWIRCEGLQKYYSSPPKFAVKDFWLGIPEGECFGFLGNNGAGKTSVLAMLSGDRIPSQGSAYLKGIDMISQQQRVRHLIGYCPQHDALFELLTGREHLELYARIKGVQPDKLSGFVEEMLDKLNLRPWANEISSSYSGGNKRKLSVGIALIGNPPIVFLDEPSTGMDPASRRSMWDLIQATMAGRSVILTTHSMEECEALCSRIGIMVSGRLRCLGSSQHLKNKFGRGYQLDVTLSLNPAVGPAEVNTPPAQVPPPQPVSTAGTEGQVLVSVSTNADLTSAVSTDAKASIPSPAPGGPLLVSVAPAGTSAAAWVSTMSAEQQAAMLKETVGRFQAFVASAFPGAQLLEQDDAHRLKFRLPQGSQSLGEIFTLIETNRRTLRIEEYSVSQTSLEQIFLQFAKMNKEEKTASSLLPPIL